MNVKPAPFHLTPRAIAAVVDDVPAARVVHLPVLPVKLVDRPRGATGPRANDDCLSAPETYTAEEQHDHASPLTGDPLDWPDAPLPEVTVIVGIDMAFGPDMAVEAAFLDGKLIEIAAADPHFQPCIYDGTPWEKIPSAIIPALVERNLAARERKSDVMYRQASDRDSRELERPVDRLAMIRAAAKAVRERETARIARLALGRAEARAVALPPLPFAQRMEHLQAAIAFLKARCVLVFPVDREALVRRYRVSGKREAMFAEEVIEHARRMGFVS